MKIVNGVPKYRRHSVRDIAFVVLYGKRVYLPGPYKSPESRKEYQRLLLEWEIKGRRDSAPPTGSLPIADLARRFWRHAKKHFTKNGVPTGTADNYRPALRLLRKYYGDVSADQFGPLSLKAIRLKMIEAGNSRRYINDNVARICKVFRWGASEELFSAAVWQALKSVEGLPKGRSAARETSPTLPVSDATVEKTLPHLPSVVADMVRFQRLVGCRSSEVCSLRPCDIDNSGPVWVYVPGSHKTEHHGKARAIFIGERAQAILRPYLLRSDQAYCFSPRDSERKRRTVQRENRKTPLNCGDVPGSNVVNRPKRSAGVCYTKDSYRRAIERACEVAFNMPKELRTIPKKIKDREQLLEQARNWRGANCWHPHQLRHAFGTKVRDQFGLEAAQVGLGHARMDATQIYAQKSAALGMQVARAIG